jgi:hypothetical protein
MAIEIRPFTVTIPAGTTIASGFTAALSMPARVVSQIDVRVPPGPRGEVGFGIGNSGVIVIPYGGASYIVTDDETLVFALENEIDSGAWQFFGYNTGSYDHTIRLYFHCELLTGAAASAGVPPPDNGGLSSGGGAGGGGGGGTPTPVPTPTPTPVPPPVPAPVVPPPAPGPPLTVPPQLPPPPGSPAPGSAGQVAALLVSLPDAGQVWLLNEDAYEQLLDQDSVNGLLAAGVGSVQLSAAMHAQLYAVSGALITVDVGESTLQATLKITHG